MFKNFHISQEVYKKINEIQPYVVLILIFLLIQSCFTIAYVPSRSMYPTFAIKEFVVAYKNPADIDYGDIILFYPKEESKEIYVKRLIGKPGDTIAIHNGSVIRNGEILIEDFTLEGRTDYEMDEIIVPDDCYFMMGDNRNASFDSRYFGSIPSSRIIGKVFFHARFFPDDQLKVTQEMLGEN